MSACKTCGSTETIDNGEACAHCGCDRELPASDGSAKFGIVQWLKSIWVRRSGGIIRQAKGDIIWWILRRRVIAKYRRTRDPHIIRHWEWKLVEMNDEWSGGRLAIEVQNLIDELKRLAEQNASAQAPTMAEDSQKH